MSDRKRLYVCVKNVRIDGVHCHYTVGQMVMFTDRHVDALGEHFGDIFEPVSFEDLFPEMMQQFDKIISTIEFHMGQDYEGT